ncbi:MAG TPA: ABC transporter ATP-binding protein [Actinomycetota bacterium]|nr:ABC transporter ATP-binding protein [Actinomycetota bacterium]
MAEAVEVTDLVKHYGRSKRGLNGISLTIGQGEAFALLGPNGAGKTTFVKCLLALLKPTSGSIALFGEPVANPEARRGVGFVPETPRFPEYLSAPEVLRMHGRLIGMSPAVLDPAIDAQLEAVDLVDAPKRVKAFSKGMVRRLALAQALLGDPRLVVLDEPTADLDPIGRRNVRNQIAALKERGTTVVLNSHLLSEVERLCDHVGIVHKGRLVAEGGIDELVPEGQDLESVFVDLIEKAGT